MSEVVAGNASRHSNLPSWPDRVLARRVGARSETGTGTVDLFGTAALVWVALEVPLTLAELLVEMGDVGAAADDVEHAVDLLVTDRMVARIR